MSDFHHPKYDYQAVQGDKQELSETLEHPDGTTPDLSGRSVTAIVRHVVSDTKVVDAAATIDDAAAGSVSYVLSTAETGREGLHHVEFEVTGGSTDPTTFPVEEPLALNVRASVEGGDDVADLEENATFDTIEANEVGTAANPVDEAYHEMTETEKLSVGDGATLSDLLGTNLSQTNGVLEATDTDTQRTAEEVQDIVGAFVSGGTNATVSYDDANDALTISANHDHSGDTLGTASSPVATAHVETTETEKLLGEMVGTRHSVPSGESVTIPEGYSEVVVGPYDLVGELAVNGPMEIR